MSSTSNKENLYRFAARLLFKHSMLDPARIKYDGHIYRMNAQCQRSLRLYYILYIIAMNVTILISVRLLITQVSLLWIMLFILLALSILLGSMPYFLRYFLPLHDRSKLIGDQVS